MSIRNSHWSIIFKAEMYMERSCLLILPDPPCLHKSLSKHHPFQRGQNQQFLKEKGCWEVGIGSLHINIWMLVFIDLPITQYSATWLALMNDIVSYTDTQSLANHNRYSHIERALLKRYSTSLLTLWVCTFQIMYIKITTAFGTRSLSKY